MKNLIKKNQLMITALAIMIAIAGYLQFAGTDFEKEYLTVNDGEGVLEEWSTVDNSEVISEHYTTGDLLDLSEEDILQEGLTEIDSLDSEYEDLPADSYLDAEFQTSNLTVSETPEPGEGEIPGEAVFTSSRSGTTILSEAKLLKEQTRAKNKETLMEIINSSELTEAQKQQAVDSMVRMTEISERESAAEILLEAKGFRDVVVSMNGEGVDVVVNEARLDEIKRAQIEDIVTRKTAVSPENIIISTVVQ